MHEKYGDIGYRYFDATEKRNGLMIYAPFVNFAIRRARMTSSTSLKEILVVNSLMQISWDETLPRKGKRT